MNFVFQKFKTAFFTFALVTLLKQNLTEFYQYFNWNLTAPDWFGSPYITGTQSACLHKWTDLLQSFELSSLFKWYRCSRPIFVFLIFSILIFLYGLVQKSSKVIFLFFPKFTVMIVCFTKYIFLPIYGRNNTAKYNSLVQKLVLCQTSTEVGTFTANLLGRAKACRTKDVNTLPEPKRGSARYLQVPFCPKLLVRAS